MCEKDLRGEEKRSGSEYHSYEGYVFKTLNEANEKLIEMHPCRDDQIKVRNKKEWANN